MGFRTDLMRRQLAGSLVVDHGSTQVAFGRITMAGAPNRREAAKAAAELVLRNELDRAAAAAADAIREHVRAIPAGDAMSSLSMDKRSR